MAFESRVKDSTTSTGTTAITLSGTAPAGFRDFTAIGVGYPVAYAIVQQVAGEWEEGIGTRTATTTFARTLVTRSSNSNALVNFSAGTKDVFITIPGQLVMSPGRVIALIAGLAPP